MLYKKEKTRYKDGDGTILFY